MRTRTTSPQEQRAFTRLELVVCAATVCALLGLTAPALARGQVSSQLIGCIANKQKLIAAWSSFVADRDGRLPGKHTIALEPPSLTEPWVTGSMTWDGSTDNTNILRLTTRRNSSLSVYLAGNAEAFRCPADIYVSSIQRSRGWTARVRSVAANVLVGEGDDWNPDQGYFRTVRKASELTKPSPGETFVFIDEHPDSLNDGSFFPPSTPTQWADLPASYHQRGVGLAMADGSAQVHSWQSRRTEIPVRFQFSPAPVFAGDNQDLIWLRAHSPQR